MKKLNKIALLFIVIFAFAATASAAPWLTPCTIKGTIYECNGVTQVAAGTGYSIENLNTAQVVTGSTFGTPPTFLNTGHYEKAVGGDGGANSFNISVDNLEKTGYTVVSCSAGQILNNINFNICPKAAPPVCGNGIPEQGEDCDPGADVPGDCCSAACNFETSQYECRTGSGECDAAEYCSGSSALCPTDQFQPDQTPCNDGLYCNTGEVCLSGACSNGYARDCSDSVDCTVDSCDENSDICVYNDSTCTGPPQGLSVLINNGDSITQYKDVSLKLSAVNADECRYINEGESWSLLEPYTTNKAWNLTDGSGTKVVYYQCWNSEGFTTQDVWDSIYYSAYSQPPSNLNIVINGGAEVTYSSEVGLALSADNAEECRYINEGESWSSWEAYTTSKAWTLAAGSGTKVVYYQCRNSYGQSTEDSYDSIFSSRAIPSGLNLLIDNGNERTVSRSVGLILSAGNAYECRYINEGESWSSWEPYTTSKQWELTPGYETKIVYYQCQNEASQTSTEDSYDTIAYLPPIPSGLDIIINNNDATTTTASVALALYADNAYQCRYRNEAQINETASVMGDWSLWEAYTATKSWELIPGLGDKAVYYQCKNEADEVGPADYDQIKLVSGAAGGAAAADSKKNSPKAGGNDKTTDGTAGKSK